MKGMSRFRTIHRLRQDGVRRAARRLGRVGMWGSRGTLRTALLAVLALEIVVVGAGADTMGKACGRIRFLHREEICTVEWIAPSDSGRDVCAEIYGIRFRPDTLELQIYHRQETVLP